MRKVIIIVFTLLLGVAFFSCKKTSNPAPGPPVVTYKDFSVVSESEAYFHFDLTDPDGDIGLKNSDTTGSFAYGSVYYNDFHMRLQIKDYNTGAWKDTAVYDTYTHKTDSFDFNYRIPYIDLKSKDKSLTCEVHVAMTGYRKISLIKKFRYKFYIYDRAHNRSNLATSPEFNYP